MVSDFKLSPSLKLQQARLGNYSKHDKSIYGINHMTKRLETMGGHDQQERMIHDKRKTLHRALRFSYQAATIYKTTWKDEVNARALINPNQLKQDYDDKIISIDFEYGIQPGDVFEWKGTNTYWLVYLQELTELAYFRGNIRKCSYKINWKQDDNIHSTWAAIKGPAETQIENIIKDKKSIDLPNYSLSIMIPANEDTIEYFQRYTKFYLSNINNSVSKVCWRVEAVDAISTPGVLEIHAKEYYSNAQEDDIEQGIVEGLIEETEVISNDKNFIYGETFIKPQKQYEFIYRGTEKAEWFVDCQKYPIKYEIDKNKIFITWLKPFSGEFKLYYGDLSKTIVVESLF